MIDTFSKEKNKILSKLRNLKERLIYIENNFELDLGDIKTKVDKSIDNILNEKFSMAFFGAFTDGKSSTLSALTKRLDIKIAPEPMTDEIKEYEYKDYYIIDTPGLFSENFIHDDKTKKYISESNIILYVVDSVVPLKESHYNIVRWLLHDLDKLESTIFVINKMDEVADLDDEEDYRRASEIKKKVVYDTLDNIVDLKARPKIVCISANPFDLGLEYWMSKETEYLRLSHIEELINEIDSFISKRRDELLIKAGFSVIRDSIEVILKKINELKENVAKQIKLFSNQKNELENKLDSFSKDVNRKYENIKNEIINLREDILSKINSSVDAKDLNNQIISAVGEDGYLLNEKINSIIMKNTQGLYDEEKRILKDIEMSIEFHDDIQKKIIGMSANVLSKLSQKILEQSSRTLADMILKVRDLSGLSIKFKPWGAIKWGERIIKFCRFLNTLPLILDVITTITNIHSERKFVEKKDEVIKEVEGLFKDFITSFSLEEYINSYFPLINETMNIKRNIDLELNNYIQLKERLDGSIVELERILI